MMNCRKTNRLLCCTQPPVSFSTLSCAHLNKGVCLLPVAVKMKWCFVFVFRLSLHFKCFKGKGVMFLSLFSPFSCPNPFSSFAFSPSPAPGPIHTCLKPAPANKKVKVVLQVKRRVHIEEGGEDSFKGEEILCIKYI